MKAKAVGYEEIDKDFIEYPLFEREKIEKTFGIGTRCRLPGCTDTPEIVFIGAAQTFGRYCQRPFWQIIHENLGVRTFNLSRPGCSPSFWKETEEVIKVANSSRLLVYQIPSARSTTTSKFKSESGGRVGITNEGHILDARQFLEKMLTENYDEALQYVSEIRKNYINDTMEFLEKIEVPKIALWISKRPPGLLSRLNNDSSQISSNLTHRLTARKLMGKFPQYVDSKMMMEIETVVDATVYCVSNSGLPQTLRAIDGSDRTHKNNYYPSQEMHLCAAKLLEPVCQSLLV